MSGRNVKKIILFLSSLVIYLNRLACEKKLGDRYFMLGPLLKNIYEQMGQNEDLERYINCSTCGDKKGNKVRN
jgi:hypothetical protein